jgi:hypothetical protein
MMQGPGIDSKVAFEFLRASYLVQVLPFRARSLGQLLTAATLAPETSLFYHLHHAFFRSPERLPEYPNDFASWAHASLGDAVVAERLANLNLTRTASLSGIRREISVILAEHLQDSGDGRHVGKENEFIFCRPCGLVFSTGQRAETPGEFLEVLQKVEIDAIFYHLFTPRLLRGASRNDFSTWFERRGFESLSQRLAEFDPYLNSLEDNRRYLMELVSGELKSRKGVRDA